MTQIILKNKEGNIAIMSLISGDIEDAVKKFQDCHPEYTSYVVNDDIKLPESRLFRDAWRLSGNKKIVVDEIAAKEIHISRIRDVRNQRLADLDREQLKNLAVPGMIVEIDKKKQVLRDLPSKINGLEWPEELNF